MADLYTQLTTEASSDTSEVGTIRSVLSGIGSGLFKIPEGLFSLGATLIDLGAGTDKAAYVEEFFAKINPFDEAAEATTAGKITELIVNLGVPGGIAFRAGSNLAKVAIAGKKSGKYLDNLTDISKLSRKNKITKFDELATMRDKIKAFGAGAGLGGVAEGVFVGEVEEAGTFGDLLGGPTEVDREAGTPQAELLNRLKFGVEGALFTGALGAVGLGVKKLRNQISDNKAVKGELNKWIRKYVKGPFSSAGEKPSDVFRALKTKEGKLAGDINAIDQEARQLDSGVDGLFPWWKRLVADKTTEKERAVVLSRLNKVLGSSELKKRPNESDAAFAARKEIYLKNKQHQKMNPTFETIDEVAKDETTGYLFAPGKGQLKNYKEALPDAPDNLLGTVKTLDPITGKDITVNTKTGNKLFSVRMGDMNANEIVDFQQFLKNKHGVEFADSAMMIDRLKNIRAIWGQLFTKMGRRLSPKAQEEFQTLMTKYVNNWMESGYKAFQPTRNDPFRFLNNYRPAKVLITKIADGFMEIADKKNVKLSKLEAEKLVNGIVDTARMPNPWKLKSMIDFEGPQFLKKSFAGEALDTSVIRLDELSTAAGINSKKLIQELLGKTESVMPTILESTNKLAAVVRYNEMNDFLKTLSNSQHKAIKDKTAELIKGGMVPEMAEQTAIRALKAPLFANTKEEIMKLTGAGPNQVSMFGGKMTPVGVKGTESKTIGGETVPLDRFRDPDFELGSFSYMDKKGKVITAPIINALDGQWALNETLVGMGNVQKSFLGDGFASQLYQNLILYPKATSQMAKTILAPFTHARNFLSAGAFAAANGLIPFADREAVKQAKNALQIFGRTKQGNELYQEMLRYGVVNTQVQVGDLMRIMEDAGMGQRLGEIRALKGMMKKLGKFKRFAQDAYTAEDDFWKIFTWFGERGRIGRALDKEGFVKGKKYLDIDGNEFTYNDEWIKGEAAKIVRNQVPNYSYVSDFIKALRQLPLGNFIAFPAEILRTGTNIVERGLKEYNYGVKMVKNGDVVTVNPFRSIGLTRLTGMALTTTAVPYAAVEAGKAIYNVSEDEINAMRRYVANWSKNSTLVPLRDKDGKLEYIDFSHMNAYDTLTRPIQTVINSVQQGRTDNDGIMGDFMLGLAEATKELGEPFISESIWTEALSDIVMRGGRTRAGKPIWNPEDKAGNKIYDGLGHLVESQLPFNWKQMGRLGLSMKPIDSKGRFDEYGNEYEFGNEALGILGMRSVKIDPKKSLNFKITDYKKGIRNSRNLFTRAVLKGGPVTPEQIVDAYIYDNEALYNVNRDMYEDIRAAKILGTSSDFIEDRMINRGERRSFNALTEGQFRPLSISREVKQLFEARFSELGLPNAFEQAEDAMDGIKEILEKTPLSYNALPTIPNPFRTRPILDALPTFDNTTQGVTPMNLNVQNLGATITQNANARIANINPTSGLTLSEEVLLEGQPLYKAMARQKNQNKMQLQRPKNNIMST